MFALVLVGAFSNSAEASITDRIPAHYHPNGHTLLCDQPPYNVATSFVSYKIGIAPGDSAYASSTTTGTGACTGSFDAPGNITNVGTSFITLYTSTTTYGYIEVSCLAPVATAGDCVIVTATSTSFISVINPPNNQVYAQNPIQFSGNFLNRLLYTEIQFELVNTSQGTTSINVEPVQISATNQTLQVWSVPEKLPLQGIYTLKARMYDVLYDEYSDWSNTSTFTLGSTTGNVFTGYIPEDCGVTDIGCYIKNALAWAFYPTTDSVTYFTQIPEIVRGKKPFSYISSAKDEILLQTTASTTAPINVTIDFPNMAIATNTLVHLPSVTFLSTTTVHYFFSDSTWALFQNLMALAIYIGLFWLMFKTTMNIFN